MYELNAPLGEPYIIVSWNGASRAEADELRFNLDVHVHYEPKSDDIMPFECGFTYILKNFNNPGDAKLLADTLSHTTFNGYQVYADLKYEEGSVPKTTPKKGRGKNKTGRNIRSRV